MNAPVDEGKVAGWVGILKSLTLTNVLILALIAMVAAPCYFVYRLLNDQTLFDRFMSSYEESVDMESGCTIRMLKVSGGPKHWSVTTGFAMTGSDRYLIAVIVNAQPSPEAVKSYCATLNLMADKMQGGNRVP